MGTSDYVVTAGGLDLEVRFCRLAKELKSGPLEAEVTLPLDRVRDNSIWIRVTNEDGYQAWTSPIYLIGEGRHDGIWPTQFY